MERPRTKTTDAEKQKARDLAIEAARLAADSNCEDVVVLDLQGQSPVTDYYVIATGTSDRQMRSVADDIERHGAANGSPAWRTAGLDSATWILLDFVDVVVHLFDAEHRPYYDLELLWGDAPRVEWQRPGGEPAEQ
jgi:ribosome-associated protein